MRWLSWKLSIATILILFLCRGTAANVLHFTSTPAAVTPVNPTQPIVPLSTSTPFIPATNPPSNSHPTNLNFQVYFHPDGSLYVGDQVSIEVVAPAELQLINQAITVTLDSPPRFLASTTFQPFGFESRQQATFYWIWNTHGQPAGQHWLTFSIPSLDWTWKQSVSLLPAEALPKQEQQAHWQSAETDCCVIYTLSGSAADRDQLQLSNLAEDEFQSVQKQIPQQPKNTLEIAFIPRVIGQGGFADQNVTISYLDRNYTAADTRTILHHELVHIFDRWNGGNFKPTIFLEGLAVYLSGGHYQPEPLLSRAAALIPLQRYISLPYLANHFYPSQHEISYLEAGALVEYIVQRWGWQSFMEFYQSIQQEKDEDQSNSIDRALRNHFHLTFAELERDFLARLKQLPTTKSDEEKLQALIEYYETIRSYQQVLDHSAYYQSGWMVNVNDLINRNIVADYWRHPSSLTNITIETMLNRAGQARQQGDTTLQNELTTAVSWTLERIRANDPQPFLSHPLAQAYWQIVKELKQAGFEAQRITVNGNSAQAFVTQNNNDLIEVNLQLNTNGWKIQSTTQP